MLKGFVVWDIIRCCPLKINDIWRNKSLPSSGTENKPSKKPAGSAISRLRSEFSSASPSTLKTEATWSSETLVDSQRKTRRCISGDRTLHISGCECLRRYEDSKVWSYFNILPLHRFIPPLCSAWSMILTHVSRKVTLTFTLTLS
jgi:hypothetical protein